MQALLSVLFVCAFPQDLGDLCDLYLRPPPRALKIEGSGHPPGSAIDRVPRIWRALAGDRVELDGTAYDLRGVITCRPDGDAVTCRKEGRDMATGMIDSGLCYPHAPHSKAGLGKRAVSQPDIPGL